MTDEAKPADAEPEKITYEAKPGDPEVEEEVRDPYTTEVARQVLAGHWGRGLNRNKKLQEAGVDPQKIDAEILKIMNQ